MIKFVASQLHRAIDMAAMPARLASDTLPILCQVKLETTAASLMATPTDRYQLARTRAEYVDSAFPETGMPETLISRDDLKTLLPMLKTRRDAVVGLAATPETITVRFYDTGQQATFPNTATMGEFPKLRALFRGHEEGTAAAQFGINAANLKALTMTALRHGARREALHFSLSPAGAAKPIAWTLDDWAEGLIMPVRLPAGASNMAHEIMRDATPLPVGTGDPDTAPSSVSTGAATATA